MKNTRNNSLLVIVLIFTVIFLPDRINLDQLLSGQPSTPTVQTTQTPSSNQPSGNNSSTQSSQDDTLVMKNIQVYDLDGNLAYEGDMDLAPVFDRIERGESDPHDNDGSVFSNREGSLPKQSKGYYHEYVVRTPGMKSVGPQRLILGGNGEAYYTPDHYDTFTQVR
jgi:ribonuclease T1